MKNPLIIILIGKSGSGKGTQADLLMEKFSLDYIGAGNMIRARMKKEDFTGRKIKSLYKKGILYPVSVVFDLWLDNIEKFKKKKNFRGLVIDGNPRRLIEAQLMDSALGWYEWDKNVKVILVDISDKEAILRLTKRRICKNCKELIPYVGEFKKLKKCHKCGGQLIKRADDTIKSAKNRINWFKKDVGPAINYYEKTGRLIKINGEQPINDVFKDILKELKA